MGKTETRRESWQERRKKIKHKWAVPLIFIEWNCERLSDLLKRWAFLEILEHLGRLAILVAIISYVCEYPERRMQAENQRKAKRYQAWQVINSAQGKPGSGGRMDALQDLYGDGVSLAGVDISKANLPKLNLENANLDGANLAEASLWGANLARARFHKANLAGAILVDANLAEASLPYADVNNVKGWEGIENIELANIYGLKNPPDGFIGWAIQQGAVHIVNHEEWEALVHEKRQGKTKAP